MSLRGFSVSLCLLLGSATAWAEAGEYPGVAPEAGHAPPRAQAIGESRMLTWPGFQQLADGRSRFFVQVSKPVKLKETKRKRQFELMFLDTQVLLKNSWYPLETRFFETPVTRARVKRSGRSSVSLIFEMREDQRPTITQKTAQDGFNYVYVDFDAPATGADMGGDDADSDASEAAGSEH